MNIERLKHSRKLYEEKYLLSGFLIRQIEHFPIGTPCMVSLNPKETTFRMPDTNQKYKPPPWGGYVNTQRPIGRPIVHSAPGELQTLPVSLRQEDRVEEDYIEEDYIEEDRVEENIESHYIGEDRVEENIEPHNDWTQEAVTGQRVRASGTGGELSINEGSNEDSIVTENINIDLNESIGYSIGYSIDETIHNFEEGIKERKVPNKKANKEKFDLRYVQKKDNDFTVADIIAFDKISEVNENLRKRIKTFKAIVLFSSSQINSFVTMYISPFDFCYSKQKPIIYDNNLYMKPENFKRDVNSVKDFSLYIKSLLKTYRFVNYTIGNIGKSNINSIRSDIELIIISLMNTYKYNTNLHRYVAETPLPLLDVVSISFYKIEDVIAIFDYKRLDGICMELSFTSSDYEIDINNRYNTTTYRFIFSKYKDNLFTIDGESIKRQYDIPISEGLHEMCRIASINVPNDTIL